MSNKVPQDVARKIKSIVFDAADQVDYLSMTRSDSGAFLNGLISRPEVGLEIAKYVRRGDVRHYIKDAILNRYSKDKVREATPVELEPIISLAYGLQVGLSHKESKLHLYKSISSEKPRSYVVISEGTFLKWEAALKRALLFIGAQPFSKRGGEVHILLLLFAHHKPIAPSDLQNLNAALERCGAKAHIFGER